MMTKLLGDSDATAQRTASLFQEHQQSLFKRTDRLFAGLLAFEWCAGIIAALLISPQTWAGASSQTHLHVWAAVYLGGAIISFPLFLALFHPGAVVTRHVIAVAQMLISALLIHLTGGRIETHFHVFGSLAFLTFYRDWRVLISASAVVAADHFLRGVYWPQSVYGVLTASPWRSFEHAGWVIFEDVFLVSSCLQGVREMWGIAERQARLEAVNERIETTVIERTAELKASEARFRSLNASSPIGVFQIDAIGRCSYTNDRWLEIVGLTTEESFQENWSKLIHPEDHDAVLTQWAQALSTDCELSVEFRLLKPTGEVRWVHARLSAMRTVEGSETASYVGTIEDISERRRIAEELLNAKEAAEAANHAKSEFLASMSHEIRTPMNGVIGMTGLLLDTKLTAEQREYAEIVRHSADALLTILNDILDFSKVEAGKLMIEPISFDLRTAVEEVVEVLAIKAEEKGLELVVRCAPDLPHRVIGDPGRVRQILINLVGNAIKFTQVGHVLINIESEGGIDGEVRLRLTIKDTGIGIPEDKIDKIFDKFTQADASTTRRFGGTGLGLAISKQLIELMGGTIEVTSRIGEGSTFCFTLRLRLDNHERSTSLPQGALMGVRILIVDDNEVNRCVLREQVTHWGMRNDSVASGREALTALRVACTEEDPYQVAILDYQMPGMDGEELGRAIKADPLLQKTSLIMLTSLGDRDGEAKRLEKAGFAAYLHKPARQAHLFDVLSAVVGVRSQSVSLKLVTSSSLEEAQRTETPLTLTEDKGIHARVLVAEDNTVNQKLAVRLLEKLGCRVDVAANGKEAVEMIALLPYDLVFMDCQMPEMDGFDATRLIREREGKWSKERRRLNADPLLSSWESSISHLPIIALTANAMQGDRERCLAAGMDDYVSKPMKAAVLKAVLYRWLPQAQSEQGVAQGDIGASVITASRTGPSLLHS